MTPLYLTEFPDFVGNWFESEFIPFEKMSLNSSIKSVFKGYKPLKENQDASTDLESQEKSPAFESRESLSSGQTLLEREETEKKKGFRIDARVISDAIIGLSDGLTVPFALTAGLSALGSKHVVIYGGLAELTAGAISMGLGGYLGARSEE
jgi:hypothetical protein